MTSATDAGTRAVGVGLALGAFSVWGAIPVYFKAIAPVPALEIISHRALLSAPILAPTSVVPYPIRLLFPFPRQDETGP